MSRSERQGFTVTGWCFSAGCRYVSLMHGLSSRFHSSLRVQSRVLKINPSFPPRLERAIQSERWRPVNS